MKLPRGWKAQSYSTWVNGSHVNSMVYKHKEEGLQIQRDLYPCFRIPLWKLEHNGKDTGHRFRTATEAIEHAEDARIHGH